MKISDIEQDLAETFHQIQEADNALARMRGAVCDMEECLRVAQSKVVRLQGDLADYSTLQFN